MSEELKKEVSVEEKPELKAVNVKIEKVLADTFKDSLPKGTTQADIIAEFMQNYLDNSIVILNPEILNKLNEQLEAKYGGIAETEKVINALIKRYLEGKIVLEEKTTVEFN